MTAVEDSPRTVPPSLACRDLTVDLGGRRVLDGVSVAVEPGEWLTVAGPNGAGKSTLLRIMAGLQRATGEILLDGKPAARLHRRERARRVALVPQHPVIPPAITVVEYVLLGRTPYLAPLGSERRADLDAAEWALRRLDLLELVGRTVDSLSGGERQRAFLARALAQQAPVVLLDEPTTALDLGHQQHVLDLVDELRSTLGRAVVSTMHDLGLVGQYADRVLLLDAGRIVAEGPPAQVLTEERLAALYGARVRVVWDQGRPAVIPLRGGEPRRCASEPAHARQQAHTNG